MTREELAELAKAERRAYAKAWRAANPEKVKEHNESYWRRRAEAKAQEGGREHGQKNTPRKP